MRPPRLDPSLDLDLMVHKKIISGSLPIIAVYEKVWRAALAEGLGGGLAGAINVFSDSLVEGELVGLGWGLAGRARALWLSSHDTI